MNSSSDSSISTRSIVTDYFNWRLRNQTVTNHRLFNIVRRIATECEASYHAQELVFNFRFSTSSSLIDAENIHFEIAVELFNDGVITWSRVITLIAFSAILAECLIHQQSHNTDSIISAVIDWTTNFIDVHLHQWLEDQNYWDGFINKYEKIPKRRDSFTRYAKILGTIGMLTLGALYMNRT